MLELLIHVLYERYIVKQIDPPPIKTVFVTATNAFPELAEFVDTCTRKYDLDVTQIHDSMKAAFKQFLSENEKTKAVFVGTRRNDPHGEFLEHFDPTDHGWPKFMRIHPVIDWTYEEIWEVC